jgi:hypothetical protein
MTKETKSEEKETKQQEGAGEEPQVFAVQRDLNGWRFSRRDFLAAASAAAAAVVAGKTAGCTPARKAVATVTPVPPTSTHTPMPIDTPTQAPTRTPTPVPTDTLTPTRTPTSTKTPTPTKTSTPTKTYTPTPTDTAVVPVAQFIEDVTIPDGTVMEPGQAFTKTWRLKNAGLLEWGEGSNLSFEDGEQMGGASPVAVPNVQPGETVDISVDMAAPAEVGSYFGKWRLLAGGGAHLMTITVVIVVASNEPIVAGQEGVEIQTTEPDGTTRTWTLPCGSPIPPGAVCVCDCVAVPVPGEVGEVPEGETGINFKGPGGETRTMPCGSPIPPGWTCTCNCVSAPAPCTCDAVTTHYWYPC